MKTAKQMTLGSLFDGIGGFPLAGVYAGMKPVWASEIEPFPIRVTEKRLPGMKHYGDIHRLSGAGLEPWTWSRLARRARISPLPGNAAALKARAPACFIRP